MAPPARDSIVGRPRQRPFFIGFAAASHRIPYSLICDGRGPTVFTRTLFFEISLIYGLIDCGGNFRTHRGASAWPVTDRPDRELCAGRARVIKVHKAVFQKNVELTALLK